MIKVIAHGHVQKKPMVVKPIPLKCRKWEIFDGACYASDGKAIGCGCQFTATADDFVNRKQVAGTTLDEANIICPECGLTLIAYIPHTDEYIQGEEND
jgi:hypothetical protein